MGLAYAIGVETTPYMSDNAWVLNLRIGYHFVDWFSLQFDFDAYDINMQTYMATARLWDRFYSTRPFLSVGLGRFNAGDSGTDSGAKFGLGMEYFPYENISFGSEITYVMGFNDLDYIDYFTLAVGASLHF